MRDGRQQTDRQARNAAAAVPINKRGTIRWTASRPLPIHEHTTMKQQAHTLRATRHNAGRKIYRSGNRSRCMRCWARTKWLSAVHAQQPQHAADAAATTLTNHNCSTAPATAVRAATTANNQQLTTAAIQGQTTGPMCASLSLLLRITPAFRHRCRMKPPQLQLLQQLQQDCHCRASGTPQLAQPHQVQDPTAARAAGCQQTAAAEQQQQ